MKTSTLLSFMVFSLTVTLLAGCDSMPTVNAENCIRKNVHQLAPAIRDEFEAKCLNSEGVNGVKCLNIRNLNLDPAALKEFRGKCRDSEDIGFSSLVRAQMFSEPKSW